MGNPDERARVIEKMPEVAIECRDLGHGWALRSMGLDTTQTLVVRVLVCGRCGLERKESVVRRSGDVDRRKYDGYPEGYRTHGLGRIYAAELRAELFKRLEERGWKRRRTSK